MNQPELFKDLKWWAIVRGLFTSFLLCTSLGKCHVIFFILSCLEFPGVVIYIQYMVKSADFPFRILVEFRNNSVVICCFFRHLQPKPSAPRIPILFFEILEEFWLWETRWLWNYFGILQEFMKISANVCSDDKIPTRKIHIFFSLLK